MKAMDKAFTRVDETFEAIRDSLIEKTEALIAIEWTNAELKAAAQKYLDTVNDLDANAEATMAPMLEKAMGKLDFTRSAKELHDQIRGMNPWPGCHCAAGGKALKIHESRLAEGHGKPGELIALDPVTVACGEGALRLITVQPEGKPRMAAADWLRGARLQKGECLE